MQPQVSPAQWCKGSQWWAITRAHAYAVVGDRAVYRKLEKYCRVSGEPPPPATALPLLTLAITYPPAERQVAPLLLPG